MPKYVGGHRSANATPDPLGEKIVGVRLLHARGLRAQAYNQSVPHEMLPPMNGPIAWADAAITAAVFSDFPQIVLQRTRRGSDDWFGILDDLRLSLLDRFIAVNHDLPVMIFCQELIETDLHALRKRMQRFRGLIVISSTSSGRMISDEPDTMPAN